MNHPDRDERERTGDERRQFPCGWFRPISAEEQDIIYERYEDYELFNEN